MRIEGLKSSLEVHNSLLLETEGKTDETACWECDGFSRKTGLVA